MVNHDITITNEATDLRYFIIEYSYTPHASCNDHKPQTRTTNVTAHSREQAKQQFRQSHGHNAIILNIY